MNFALEALLPTNFSPASRVWIYQSSRLFMLAEVLQIEELLSKFVQQWQSHGKPVKGYANLLFGQFVVFIADETNAGVSGCSTDSSVYIVKQIEALYKVNMLDRLMLAFVQKEKIQTIPMAQINYAIQNKFITADTLYFNNTVLTLADLKTKWIVPAGQTWLAQKYKQLVSNVSIT
jgi:hypothetical protein